jgi:hypothetical protein
MNAYDYLIHLDVAAGAHRDQPDLDTAKYDWPCQCGTVNTHRHECCVSCGEPDPLREDDEL